jgi:O-antigen/teichoic acid export membrane protein
MRAPDNGRPLSSPRSTPTTNAPAPPSGIEERAILNTLYNSGGEIAGRFASLLLFAVAGHALGENGLGSFVFAVAFLGFVIVPVDIGLDRYMLRAIAREPSSANHLFFNVLALKLSLALPLFGAAVLGLHLVGYDHAAQLTTLALVPGTICDSIARSQFAVFMANERSGPPALADATQRICSAALGIAALKSGYGVVSVAVTYSIGSLIGVVIGFVLLARTIGMPARSAKRRSWRALASGSVPFATQDIFATLLARVDTVILALIATQAAVGSYGAAYRLFESTLFVTYALVGAFAAMFTYLSPDSDPPLRSVYQRSIKLSLVLLVPIAAAFTVLGGPICRLIYGDNFSSAAVPLGILGPGVVLLGVVTLTTSLMVSRENPRRMVPVAAAMAALNIALNLILIPLYGAGGAAAAMLATEVVYAIWITRMAAHAVHGVALFATATGALVAGAGMAIVALLLHDSLLIALACGGVVYLVTLLVIERLLNPHDVELVTRLVRRRLASGQPE